MKQIVPPGQFGMSVQVEDARHVLALSGELDMASAPTLQAKVAELCADRPQAIVIDLSELTFLDSTGLRTILSAQSMCAAQACDFSLVPGRENIQRLFALTGLLERLPFEDASKPG
jgi:anti-anti-sigma factor